jgi:antitoxin component of RelBE/YafQ-DinJ toxin-antitoxin module
MAKDTRLTLRVDSVLKNELEAIAAREGRSVAQVTEAFLRQGLKTYKQKGSKSIQDYITRRKPEAR